MQKTRLSIIIPHYNSSESLEKLLTSIPRDIGIEVIVVDDRSNLYLEEYTRLKEAYKEVVFLENISENKGAGAARNIGLSKASGEWLLFADADDYFMPKFYETIERYMENSFNDIIYFAPTSRELESGNISNRHENREKLIENYKCNRTLENQNLLKYTFPEPWSKLIRKSLVDENFIRFSETLVANDVIFSMLCGYNAKKIDVSDKVIYCVTKAKGSLTTSLSNEIIKTRANIEVEKYNFLRDKLSKEDFSSLKLDGKYCLYLCLSNKSNIRFILSILKQMRINKIKIFHASDFNVFSLVGRVKEYRRIHYINKKYVNKE